MSYQSVGQEAVARLHAQREIERLQKDYQDLVVDAEILQQKVLQLEAERDDMRGHVLELYDLLASDGMVDVCDTFLARFPWLEGK